MNNNIDNQHFVSQTEQRFNTLNPLARSSRQRIYEFELADRGLYQVRLSNPRGRKISSNLSMLDLFSFDIDPHGQTRSNFEAVFSDYEAQIKHYTESLLKAHVTGSNQVADEIFGLLVAKLINFIRNPYCVVKAINTFGGAANLSPTDQKIYFTYVRIIQGNQPQRAHVCRQLGITDKQYQTWLRMLFMLLTPMMDGVSNMLEQTIAGLIGLEHMTVHAHVHRYEGYSCLLSDRGYSQPLPDGPHVAFDFNLTSNAFIRYAFLDFKAVHGYEIPEGIRKHLRNRPKNVDVRYGLNDLTILENYQRRVIDQAHERVYCATTTPYFVSVLPAEAAVSQGSLAAEERKP